MTPEAIDAIKTKIITELSRQEKPVRRPDLMHAVIGENPDRALIRNFFEARNSLVADGRIKQGLGRGGYVSIINESVKNTEEPTYVKEITTDQASIYKEEPNKEHFYYGLVYEYIDGTWTTLRNIDKDKYVISISANKKRYISAAGWTTPDLLLFSAKKSKNFPIIDLEVYSFEVKRSVSTNITSVYEALSHRRRSNYAVLVIVHDYQNPDSDSWEDTLSHIERECLEHGIGLIDIYTSIVDEKYIIDLERSDIIHSPKYVDQDIESIDELSNMIEPEKIKAIEIVFSETYREQMARIISGHSR